jgi:hypothetical protein
MTETGHVLVAEPPGRASDSDRVVRIVLLAVSFVAMIMLTLSFWRRLTHREILMPTHVRRRQRNR